MQVVSGPGGWPLTLGKGPRKGIDRTSAVCLGQITPSITEEVRAMSIRPFMRSLPARAFTRV